MNKSPPADARLTLEEEKREIAREARIGEPFKQARCMAEMWPGNETVWARRILVDIVERQERAMLHQRALGTFQNFRCDDIR